jgi:hypothetical protein
MRVVRALEVGELGANVFGGCPKGRVKVRAVAEAAQRERSLRHVGGLLEDHHWFEVPNDGLVGFGGGLVDDGERDAYIVTKNGESGGDGHLGPLRQTICRRRWEED